MNNCWRRRFAVFACVITVGTVLAFWLEPMGRTHVRVECLHQGLEVYDEKYFPAGHYDVMFASAFEKAKLQYRLLLNRLGIPFVPVNGHSLHGQGPALVICGRIKKGFSPQLDFVSAGGERVPIPFSTDAKRNTFLWYLDFYDTDCRLTNGSYRVQPCGRTNTLANVMVRL
jgi:hypothetical protein